MHQKNRKLQYCECNFDVVLSLANSWTFSLYWTNSLCMVQKREFRLSHYHYGYMWYERVDWNGHKPITASLQRQDKFSIFGCIKVSMCYWSRYHAHTALWFLPKPYTIANNIYFLKMFCFYSWYTTLLIMETLHLPPITVYKISLTHKILSTIQVPHSKT